LVYRDLNSEKFVIVDFKTGKRSANDATQLYLYAWFIKEAFNLGSLDQIELRNEYLADGTCVSFTPNSIDLENTQYTFRTSIDHMESLMQDVEQNVPMEMEAFQQTLNESVCRRCPFLELCGRV
jgi:CRISPR/Cas system-associated exonuclease Cas4 (RecB family)